MSGDRGLAAIHAAALSGASGVAIDRGTQPAPKAAAVAAEPAAEAAATTVTMSEADAKTFETNAHAQGKVEGAKEGAAAERTRIKAIVTSEKAKGREQLAQSLAFNTNLSAEEAVTVLGAAPQTAKGSRLDGLVPQPKVDAQEAADGQGGVPAKAGLAAAVQKRIEKASRAH